MPIVKAIDTVNFDSWQAQNNYIERMMDNAAYSAAHPDDTLIVVGPPRFTSVDDLTPVGMMQNFSVSQTRPFQPMMAIGSGRQFFLGGKTQGSATIGRLFVNAKSLLRKLYSMYNLTNSGGTDIFTEAPDSGSGTSGDDFFINLDSELFLIPFGMGVIIGDKSGKTLGSFYMELCVIPSYSMGVAAGQSMILESVSVLFDRIVGMPVEATSSKFKQWNDLMSNAMSRSTESALYTELLTKNTQDPEG